MKKYKVNYYDDIINGKVVETKIYEVENERELEKITYQYASENNLYRGMPELQED